MLSLDTLTVSPDVRPAQIRVYRYRVPQLTGGVDPNLGGIPACGFQGPAGKTFGPVPWQLLVLGADYYTDPSGLWIALAQKVDLRSDYIAVSYVTEGGTTVGSFPGAPKPGASTTCASVDSLRLIVEPLVGNDQPSFWHEMRQFYRVAGQDLDPASLQVDIALNRSERPLPPSNFSTYLGALGLSIPTDQNTFDRENRLFPRARDPGAEPGRSASRTSRSPTSSRSPIRRRWGRPNWPTRSTRRRCTCCSRRVRRPSTSSGCDTTPPVPATDRPST